MYVQGGQNPKTPAGQGANLSLPPEMNACTMFDSQASTIHTVDLGKIT